MSAGVKSGNIENRVPLADEFIVNRDGSTGVQPFNSLAVQIAASGAVAERIDGVEALANEVVEAAAITLEQAQNAVVAAEAAVQYEYMVATDADRIALVGMTAGQHAFVRSSEHVWRYSGSAWVDLGLAPTAGKANKTETIKASVVADAYRTDKGLSVRDRIQIEGDTPPQASSISPRQPTIMASSEPILFGDEYDIRFGTDPESQHMFINGRGRLPVNYRPGVVVADSAGFLRALGPYTKKYRGEWQPEFDPIPPDDPPSILFDTSDPFYSVRQYQAIASIERVQTRLWACYWGSSQRPTEGPPSHIILTISDDFGATWTEYGYIAFVDPIDGSPVVEKRCYDPRLYRDQDGLLWLLVGVSKHPTQAYDYVYGTFCFSIRDAGGRNPIWSKPFKLGPFGFSARPFPVGQSLYLPVDHWRQNASLNPGKTGKHIYEFDTRRRAALCVGTIPDMIIDGYDETSGIERRNGDLFAIFRSGRNEGDPPTEKAAHCSVSKDQGYTWSEPVLFDAIGTNPHSRTGMQRTGRGRVAVIYNNSLHPARTNMTIALSEDEGETFPRSVMVSGSDTYAGYPDMAMGENGEIYAIWDGRGMTGRPISMCVVDEDDIWENGASAVVTRHTVHTQV